jgi:DNA-binding CsgD family transcriptional regulator
MFESETTSVLVSLASRFTEGQRLTPSENAEVLRIAQGFGCKDSANMANVAPETIRARRKRIYRKLHVAGANDVISRLLSAALNQLAAARTNELPKDEPLVSASL